MEVAEGDAEREGDRDRDEQRGAERTMWSTVFSSSRSRSSTMKRRRRRRRRARRRSRHPPGGRPRRHRPLREDEQNVGEEREADRQGTGSDDLRPEVEPERAEDRTAEPLGDDERGHGREGDRRDDRDAQPGEDRRQRQRQLDPPEGLARVSPIPRAASITSAGPSGARRACCGRGSGACSRPARPRPSSRSAR